MKTDVNALYVFQAEIIIQEDQLALIKQNSSVNNVAIVPEDLILENKMENKNRRRQKMERN